MGPSAATTRDFFAGSDGRLCVSVASASVLTSLTRQRTASSSPSCRQQPPRTAQVRRPKAGSNTTPTPIRPWSTKATMTENSPFLRAKPRVPSIGSTTHSRGPVCAAAASVAVASSAQNASPGNCSRRYSRMISCDCRSASVEMLAGALGMTLKFW